MGLERDGRRIVEMEEQREGVLSVVIREGGAEYSEPWKGFDWTVVEVVGRLWSAVSEVGVPGRLCCAISNEGISSVLFS